MIENEFKVMLTAEQYNAILSMFEWDKTVRQVNHYYDTDNLRLSENHITVRVRTVGGECLLQMKLPNGADYSRRELERKLSGNVPTTLSPQLLNELADGNAPITLPCVHRLGQLSTLRSIKRFDGAEVDLDKSSYFGVTDYELEIEFTDEQAARRLMEMIREKACFVQNGDVCIGKLHRFIEKYKECGGVT